MPRKSPASSRSWRNCRPANGQRSSTKSRRVISSLIRSQKNLSCRRSVQFKAATLRDNIRIVSAQFRDAMFCGKSRDHSGPSNLRAARDRDHDGRLLLTFLRFLNPETAAASDDGKDIEEIDGEQGIKENLAVGLRHVIPLQPTIYDDKVFHFDREARRLAARFLTGVALAFP